MIARKKKIVLYQPQQCDQKRGIPSSRDLLPLEMLTIATFPDREGYEVVIIDAQLYEEEEAHRRLLEACEGALLYATTGILGYMVVDGYNASKKVRERFPDLTSVVGGWFASVKTEMQLRTGFYDAVVLGQGEFVFHEIVQAVDAGEPLDSVQGLLLLRPYDAVFTVKRKPVSW